MIYDDAHAAAGVQEGQILAGKYRVEKVLGVGGMGVVVAATNIGLDTRVALKFLLPALLADEVAVARFAREARNAVKITSEHVARVLDVGTLENGAPYMMMEFLQGSDLAALLAKNGPLPLEDAVDFLLQAMEAIAEAHGLGIVHRDLKPANLFCIRRADGHPSIKVLDFGISKSIAPGSASLSLTATASFMGSPFYMSPEQMEASDSLDGRADIWALGVIAFELMTGRVPFFGESIPEVCSKIASKAPPALRDFRPDAPEGLQAVVLKCLEKPREARFRSVAELAVALLPFAPLRARPSVEKIVDILRTAAQAPRAGSMPPATELGTIPSSFVTHSSLGRTTRGPELAGGGGAGRAAIAVALGALALVGSGVGLYASVSGHHGTNDVVDSGLAASEVDGASKASGGGAAASGGGAAAEAGEPIVPEAAPAPLCLAQSTRCDGATPQTCTGDAWVSGTITAGQCGAVCTPGQPQECSGITPRQCGASGKWENLPACSKGQVCRNGACEHWAPPPPPPDCDPNYYFDAHGEKRFKPECFGVTPRPH